MSIEALVWAFATPVKPATAKLTLIALCDSANHMHEAWPSVETLAGKTSLDRKTIIGSIELLEQSALIADTGKRMGATGAVKVYRMVGLDMGNRHYTYRVDDAQTGEFYIGVRSCWCEPEADTDYLGSGAWPLRAIRDGRPLAKQILAVWPTRAEAEVAEMVAIRESSDDPLMRNSKQYRKRNSSESGTVPTFPGSSTENGTQNPKNPNLNKKKDASPSGVITFDAESGHFCGPIGDHFGRWHTAFPALDLGAQIARAEAWLVANPKNRKSNYLRFLTNWLQRAQDRAPRVAAQGAQHGQSGSASERRAEFVDDMRRVAHGPH